jgi:hypothetical protein
MIHEAQLNGSQKKAAEKIGQCPGDWKQVDFFNYSTLLFWQVKYIVPVASSMTPSVHLNRATESVASGITCERHQVCGTNRSMCAHLR